ncbi:MAG TPA: hypothetical protein VHT26_15095 [Trebonia sp.]|jgi:predicted nucleotidyltransferase|nr:hypothetical protein [Trebonia sp.]
MENNALPVLTDLLSGIAGVEQAYIYGSWAARYLGEPGPVPPDVDVLVVGPADEDALCDVAREAEDRLGREVKITAISQQYWDAPAPAESFHLNVAEGLMRHVRESPHVRLGLSR